MDLRGERGVLWCLGVSWGSWGRWVSRKNPKKYIKLKKVLDFITKLWDDIEVKGYPCNINIKQKRRYKTMTKNKKTDKKRVLGKGEATMYKIKLDKALISSALVNALRSQKRITADEYISLRTAVNAGRSFYFRKLRGRG